MNAELSKDRSEADRYILRTQRPLYISNLLWDNWVSFLVMNPLHRLYHLRQAAPFTSTHFLEKGGKMGLVGSFNDMTANGFFNSIMRGTLLRAAMFVATFGQAINLSEGCQASFCFHLTALSALLHPVETLKTRYIADGNGAYKNFAECMRKTRPTTLYNGFVFNMIAVAGLSTIITRDSHDLMSAVGLVALYPFLTLKTMSMVSADSGS